jgi:hypothetical protein
MSNPLLDDFELHLKLCPDCLTSGNNLCVEAQYIADDVRASRRPVFAPRRRPTFPTARRFSGATA